VLDLGCGVGGQTLQLAELTSGAIAAVDNHAPVIERLRWRVAERACRIACGRWSPTSHTRPSRRSASTSSGRKARSTTSAIERALQLYRPLLRPGGHLAFSDAVWRKEDPPSEVRELFEQDYPTMGRATDVVAVIGRCELDLLGHFTLPDEAWWDEFYTPMLRRVAALRIKYAADGEALAVLDQLGAEPEFYRRHSESYGYEFFVARRKA